MSIKIVVVPKLTFAKYIYMYKRLFFLITILSPILFSGCSKTAEVPLTREEEVVKYLTGSGNLVWKLSKVFVNNVAQTLTVDQQKYTKTYTISPSQALAGTFTNSDGNKGKWALNGPIQLIEVINNNMAGPVQLIYTINEISSNSLDIEYIANLTSVREVYRIY